EPHELADVCQAPLARRHREDVEVVARVGRGAVDERLEREPRRAEALGREARDEGPDALALAAFERVREPAGPVAAREERLLQRPPEPSAERPRAQPDAGDRA